MGWFFFREKPFTLLISIPWFAIICGIKRREGLSKRQRQKREKTMNRYECDYNGNIRRYTGVSAMEAIEKFSRQNHVEVSVIGVDRETKGIQYARGCSYKNDRRIGVLIDMRIVDAMKEVA